MEPAGVALGAIVLIKPLADAIAETITAERGFGTNAEELRLRFSSQQKRLQALERLLFQTDKLEGGRRIWDLIPVETQSDVIDMLRHLYELLERFLVITRKYSLVRPDQGRDAFEALFKEDGKVGKTDGNVGKLKLRQSFVGLNRAETSDFYQKRSSLTRRLRWVFRDSKSAKQIIQEFEEWNTRIKELLETVWWQMPPLATLEAVHRIESDTDAQSTGLSNGAQVRRILLTDPNSDESLQKFSAMEVHKGNFQLEKSLGPKDIGTITVERRDGSYCHRVIVEYKDYVRTAAGEMDAFSQKRIRQLALLLHSRDTDAEGLAYVPHCVAVFNDRSNDKFGFAYVLPRNHDLDTMQSLSSVLVERGKRPSLDSRLRLALKLCKAIQRLHELGWVHKSLRSENIILFSEQSDNWDSGSIMTKDSGISNLSVQTAGAKLIHPLLFGFEYSRPENAFSSRRVENETVSNLYRHPVRWGTPTERFGKAHDIYALGVILLELGLWERVDTIDRGTLKDEAARGGLAVKKKLLKHTEQRLDFYMGTGYMKAVKICLSGTLDEIPDFQVQAEFSREVTDRIAEIVEALGDKS